MKINWPLLVVITSFLYLVSGVWADMPEPFNVANGLAFLSFVAFCVVNHPNIFDVIFPDEGVQEDSLSSYVEYEVL